MKRKTDHDDLLKDVFADSAPADFREAMLGESLRVARRRQRLRRYQQATATLALLALAILWISQRTAQRTNMSKNIPAETAAHPYTLLRNEPFPAVAIITTRPMVTEQVGKSSAPVGIVQTRPGAFRAITDEELLSLISPRPCALVQVGPNSEKLVFINPEDARAFLAQ